METHLQDLQWVIDRATAELKKEPNRRLSALFRDLRKNKNYSLIGDYFIFWSIAIALHTLHMKRTKQNWSNACRNSKEYKENTKGEKMMWIRLLSGIAAGALNSKRLEAKSKTKTAGN